MKKILVTTTDTLYGWEIVNYIKPVYSNLIVGSNFFRDIGASFTDFFGGRATLYEKNIQLLNEKAVDMLSAKALELGANCILGMKVDIDEISGKNMQMFMVTAWGTAVNARNSNNPSNNVSTKEIDKEKINEQANIIRLASASLKENFKLTLKDLQIIVDTRSPEFKDILFEKFKKISPANYSDGEYNQISKLYNEYFAVLDQSLSIPIIYGGLMNEPNDNLTDRLLKIIKENDLIDYQSIRQLLDGNRNTQKLALKILQNDKSYYSANDIDGLAQIITHVNNAFPQLSTAGVKRAFYHPRKKKRGCVNVEHQMRSIRYTATVVQKTNMVSEKVN